MDKKAGPIFLFENSINDIAKCQNVLYVCHVFVIKQRGWTYYESNDKEIALPFYVQ